MGARQAVLSLQPNGEGLVSEVPLCVSRWRFYCSLPFDEGSDFLADEDLLLALLPKSGA